MISMYMTAAAVIFGGITNMIFCKTSFYRKHRSPLDGGKCLKDGRRLFGDNKTVIGFITMIVFTAFFQIIFGLLDIKAGLSEMYRVHENTFLFNAAAGALLGFSYMICELPNSFIKRRMGIEAGSTNSGINFIMDQADSMIGMALVIYLLSDITVFRAVQYVLLGSVTHVAVNLVLKFFKIRRSI